MKDLLFVVTAHKKYIENGIINRCINSLPTNKGDILIEVDDDTPIYVTNGRIIAVEHNHKLGVTQSRLAGFIYAKLHDYKWISFIDADAYFKSFNMLEFESLIERDDVAFISCSYGYHNKDDSDYIVERYAQNCIMPINMYPSEVLRRLYSIDKDYQDYPVFMGRFFNIKYISADMFVDTKMIGDDGIFLLMFLNYLPKDIKCFKIEGLCVSDQEDDKSLPKSNLDTGCKLLKWTLNKLNVDDESIGQFVFKHMIFSRLAYIWHGAKELTEQDLTDTINDIPIKFDSSTLAKSQTEFYTFVKYNKLKDICKVFEERYGN